MAVYNTIGKTYDHTRKADPEIVRNIIQFLSPSKTGSYLDVGCGSGNYTCALSDQGLHECGVDISEEMLSKARQKNPRIEWVHGDARKLPFQDRQFDGATCILATHHIQDLEKCFQEVFRVLNKGDFVIFTCFPEQLEAYWLNRYFPKMMRMASDVMHSQQEMFAALKNAGFEDLRTEKFFVTNDLQDWFLQAGKYRPELYFDPVVRAGISTFALAKDQDEISQGCEKIKEDMASGIIDEVIKSHESPLGDYAFVIATKP